MSDKSLSLGRMAWRRFRSNWTAMFGLTWILLCTVVAILGYLITPDHALYANTQHPELHILPPRSSQKVLRVMKNEDRASQSFLKTIFFGRVPGFIDYPFYKIRYHGPDVIIEEFTGGTPNNGMEAGFNMADVVYALDPHKPVRFDSLEQRLHFSVLGEAGEKIEPVTVLRKKIENELVIDQKYLLGTDLLGRDLLSRLMIGTRISLSVGLISVFISISIGLLLGATAGYFRGKTDVFILWLINVVWSIPTLLLVIAITLVLGKGITQVFIAVGLTMWVDVARIVRGQVLSIREKEFVEAGKALGYSHWRIITRHILPNVMGPVIVIAAANFASAILMEAGLSFLGIGAQPPVPSWGEMINAHRSYILMDKAYLAFIPGAAIMMLVLSFMLVGNGLRDALDTRLADSRASVS